MANKKSVVANTKGKDTKKTTSKKTTNKSTTTKKTVKSPVKKTNTKKVVNNSPRKEQVTEIKKDKNLNIEVTKYENEEKEIIEEINNVNVAKLENAKFSRVKKNKSLLAIGVLISILGLIALLISLVANRIIDREYISDSAINLMLCASLIIEGFGAFIIINET